MGPSLSVVSSVSGLMMDGEFFTVTGQCSLVVSTKIFSMVSFDFQWGYQMLCPGRLLGGSASGSSLMVFLSVGYVVFSGGALFSLYGGYPSSDLGMLDVRLWCSFGSFSHEVDHSTDFVECSTLGNLMAWTSTPSSVPFV